MIAAMGLLSFQGKAQDNNIMPDLKSWPEASQMAAKEMMDNMVSQMKLNLTCWFGTKTADGKKLLSMTWKPSIYSRLTTLM